MSLKLAILASGSGSNAQTMFDAVKSGILDADIRILICNRPQAKVLERAKIANIPHICIDHTQYASRQEYDAVVAKTIKEYGADTIAMAGYMRMVTPEFLNEFAGRVINIHPAVLPSFPGIHGAKDAVEYGVKVSGCSVHFVTAEMDAGPIIIQAIVPCLQNDSPESLQKRIHAVEHKIYIQALQWLAEERLSVKDHTVHVEYSDTCEKQVTFLTREQGEEFSLGAMISPSLEI